MPGKANIFGFNIVTDEVFLLYLTAMSQLTSVKLQLFSFFPLIQAILLYDRKDHYLVCLLAGALSEFRKASFPKDVKKQKGPISLNSFPKKFPHNGMVLHLSFVMKPDF